MNVPPRARRGARSALLLLSATLPATACATASSPLRHAAPGEPPPSLPEPAAVAEAPTSHLAAATDALANSAPLPRDPPLVRSYLVADEPATSETSAPDGEKEMSADEVARSLANPNTPLATLTFKNQFTWYDGDLPGADDESSYTLIFQPTFPFLVGDEGDVLFWRPAIPLLVSQPVPTGADEWAQKTQLGDISMDLGLGSTSKEGLLSAYGVFASFPTGTSTRVGSTGRWVAGPELLLAKFESWGLYGIFPSHQWDFAGSTDRSVNVTSTQVILNFLPGDGWSVGTTPRINYEWEQDQWTVPLNLSASKTILIGKTPVKVGFEINYYVEAPDAFGPRWVIGINLSPVVENVLATLF